MRFSKGWHRRTKLAGIALAILLIAILMRVQLSDSVYGASAATLGVSTGGIPGIFSSGHPPHGLDCFDNGSVYDDGSYGTLYDETTGECETFTCGLICDYVTYTFAEGVDETPEGKDILDEWGGPPDPIASCVSAPGC